MLRAAATAFLIALASQSPLHAAGTKTAIFAGGCFWCVEKDFDHVPGVVATLSGYSGGDLENPTYQNHEGHREVVRVEYDPAKVSYRALVDTFFRSVDPTDDGGQFCDRGFAYTTAVYTQGAEQQADAEAAKADAEKTLGQKIVSPVEPAKAFWQAEDYHQDYYVNNPVRYTYYRQGCGRDARIEQLWGAEAHKGIATH